MAFDLRQLEWRLLALEKEVEQLKGGQPNQVISNIKHAAPVESAKDSMNNKE